VKDVDFASNQIVVRDGKGHKGRVTMRPAAVKAGLARPLDVVRSAERATPYLPHSFATYLLEDGRDICTGHDLLGHNDVSPTMITHTSSTRGPAGLTSPADRMLRP